MNNKIVDCPSIARKIKEEVRQEVQELGTKPCLAVVLVGDNPASQTYVKNKEKVCNEVGIDSKVVCVDENVSQSELETIVRQLNNDCNVHGILVQLPLPSHLDEQEVIDLINPKKDVDGLTTENMGLIMRGRIDEAIVPCTPAGVLRMFDEVGYDLKGKNVTIVGRSNLFSKPMFHLALSRNATVTMCHSKTIGLMSKTVSADVLISAIGQPKHFGFYDVGKGAYVVDVGINRDENGKLCGDVNLDEVIHSVEYITPVPRGVGTLTTAMLLKNVVKCIKLQK